MSGWVTLCSSLRSRKAIGPAAFAASGPTASRASSSWTVLPFGATSADWPSSTTVRALRVVTMAWDRTWHLSRCVRRQPRRLQRRIRVEHVIRERPHHHPPRTASRSRFGLRVPQCSTTLHRRPPATKVPHRRTRTRQQARQRSLEHRRRRRASPPTAAATATLRVAAPHPLLRRHGRQPQKFSPSTCATRTWSRQTITSCSRRPWAHGR
mmetsp:Transcript_17618/g.44610  ORF Transcript_17618/g.44610 Transcript_17618/m.44610 type:complete len:210 (+) Transcript_17618:1856-2485(+)